jgi:diguanylate cyclase (GGDEF)-like protein
MGPAGVAEHRLLDGAAAYIDRWPARWIRVLAFASIPLFGLLDYWSGPEIAFSVFYLVPLSILGWVSGRDRILVGSAAVLSALTWLLADIAAGAEYEHSWIPIWNTTTRLAIFLIVVALLANLRESEGRARDLARLDPLTGVANGRTFLANLETEIRRCQRTGASLSLAYADVDDFKSINDTQGHAGGDRVLRLLATALDSSTRAVDVVGRLGGDEFAILLPETGAADGKRAMEAITERMAERTADLGFPVTFSLGCVTFVRPPGDAEEMIHAADELMYDAKREGKDRVHVRVIGLETNVPS